MAKKLVNPVHSPVQSRLDFPSIVCAKAYSRPSTARVGTVTTLRTEAALQEGSPHERSRPRTCAPASCHAVRPFEESGRVQIGAKLGAGHAGKLFKGQHPIRGHLSPAPFIDGLRRDAERRRERPKSTNFDGSICCDIKFHGG